VALVSSARDGVSSVASVRQRASLPWALALSLCNNSCVATVGRPNLIPMASSTLGRFARRHLPCSTTSPKQCSVRSLINALSGQNVADNSIYICRAVAVSTRARSYDIHPASAGLSPSFRILRSGPICTLTSDILYDARRHVSQAVPYTSDCVGKRRIF
jgi:hypothetical protein